MRTHADTTLDHGLRSIEALVEVRRRVADVIDVEIVALCGWPVTGADGEPQRALLREALAMGADVVGGCPHLDDGGTRAATEVYLQIATDHGVGVDLHTDETLDAVRRRVGRAGRRRLGDRVRPARHGQPLRQPGHEVRRPSSGRSPRPSPPPASPSSPCRPRTCSSRVAATSRRCPGGSRRCKALRDAGAVVAAGADNLQDPFNPLGRACPFETAGLMVWTAHLSPADAWACVTEMAARALGRPPLAIAVGAPADLMAVPVASLREAIASGAPRRTVWHHGHRV